VQILLPIVHALATAHEKGIVHRDVKPENIFLMQAEVGVVPKLLDFGIARRVDYASRLTLDGALLGTPDYMSPEQARGADSGTHTDQWSFCVVLYELLSGVVPFQRENYNALLRAIIEEPPKPLAEVVAVDAKLAQIVERGLLKDPGQRWGSMRDIGEALACWLLDQGVVEDCTGKSLRRTWLHEESGRFDISHVSALVAEAAAASAPGHTAPHAPVWGGRAAVGVPEPPGPALEAQKPCAVLGVLVATGIVVVR
jgi:serine/threonine-protein kinase